MTAMLLEVASTSLEYAGCKILDVLITRSLALRFVRSTPWAGLNPGDKVLHKLAKALRLKCVDHALIGALPLGLGLPYRLQCERRQLTAFVDVRHCGVGDINIQISSLPELV